MKFLDNIRKEAVIFLKQCWFLVLLLILALLAYPAARKSEFWVWTSLSYVTSFIFYVLTIYLPQRRNQRNIHRVVVPYLQTIINDIRGIFYAFLAASREKCDLARLTEQDIEKVFKVIHPQDKSTKLEFLGFTTWAHYLESQKVRVRRSADRILGHGSYLDTDFIHQLESLHNSALFEILDAIKDRPLDHDNFSFMADAYMASYRQADELEAYLKRYRGEI